MLGLDVILPAAVGVVFIYSSLIIAFVYPEPSPYQVFVFRTVLALAAAGFAAAIPGLLNISINLPGLTIRAAGAFASFIIVYRVDPDPPSARRNSLELIVDIYRVQNSQKNTKFRNSHRVDKELNYRSFDKENGNLKIIQPDNKYLDSIKNGGEVRYPRWRGRGSLNDDYSWEHLMVEYLGDFPKLDIKLVNNTYQTVFFSQINIQNKKV